MLSQLAGSAQKARSKGPPPVPAPGAQQVGGVEHRRDGDGLVTNTRATEMGRLTRKTMAAAAAMSHWPNGGMYIMNSPTAKAPAADRR